jgi:hypothetical protein
MEVFVRAILPLRPMPQRGHRALNQLLGFLRCAFGFVDELPRGVKTMRGEKFVGFGGVEVGHGVSVD